MEALAVFSLEWMRAHFCRGIFVFFTVFFAQVGWGVAQRSQREPQTATNVMFGQAPCSTLAVNPQRVQEAKQSNPGEIVPVQSETGTATNRSQMLQSLEMELERITSELYSIKREINGSSAKESRNVLFERVGQFENTIHDLREQIRSERVAGPPTPAPAIGHCDELERACEDGCRRQIGTQPERKAIDTKTGSDGLSAVQAAEIECISSQRVSESHLLNKLVVTMTNGEGHFSKGQNIFHVEFTNVGNENSADPGDLQMEATMILGRVNVMRAVVRFVREDVGHYRATVDLSSPGLWLITIMQRSPSSKGKAVFLARIN